MREEVENKDSEGLSTGEKIAIGGVLAFASMPAKSSPLAGVIGDKIVDTISPHIKKLAKEQVLPAFEDIIGTGGSKEATSVAKAKDSEIELERLSYNKTLAAILKPSPSACDEVNNEMSTDNSSLYRDIRKAPITNGDIKKISAINSSTLNTTLKATGFSSTSKESVSSAIDKITEPDLYVRFGSSNEVTGFNQRAIYARAELITHPLRASATPVPQKIENAISAEALNNRAFDVFIAKYTESVLIADTLEAESTQVAGKLRQWREDSIESDAWKQEINSNTEALPLLKEMLRLQLKRNATQAILIDSLDEKITLTALDALKK